MEIEIEKNELYFSYPFENNLGCTYTLASFSPDGSKAKPPAQVAVVTKSKKTITG